MCIVCVSFFLLFFFFNDTATTEIYTLSLHDALPISGRDYANSLRATLHKKTRTSPVVTSLRIAAGYIEDILFPVRSEEHTSELQSQSNLVCRLLLEKKKKKKTQTYHMNKYIILYIVY